MDEFCICELLRPIWNLVLSDFVAWRRGDVAPITLQKQLSTVRQALRYWADIEGVTDGLAEKLHAPELPDGAEVRDVHLESHRASRILEHLDRYDYASRRHVVISILWRTGMRRSALRSLDLDDLRPDDHAVVLEHRPETGTKLKNHHAGERWVYLGPRWFQIIEDYVDKHRIDATDDYGRESLITTQYGRPIGDTIYTWANRVTQPCEYGLDCPHDHDPKTCEAATTDGYPSRCPSARSPHAIRRGSITHHLNHGTSPKIASERMDVSLKSSTSTMTRETSARRWTFGKITFQTNVSPQHSDTIREQFVNHPAVPFPSESITSLSSFQAFQVL